MSDPAVGIKDLLVAASIGAFGGTAAWGIFIGKVPPTPQAAIAVVTTGGLPSNPKYLLDYPSVQVLIRGVANGYAAARVKAQAVKDVLLGLESQVINGDKWVHLNTLGDIQSLGYDENNCPMFSLNFSLIIEPATNVLTNREPL